MIVLECEQGSRAWIDARIGIPTASNFHRICPPKTRKMGKGAETYMQELLAEWMTGEAMDAGVSAFMERGTEMEREALRWYEFEREVEVDRCGFIYSDDRTMGCSPDGLVGDDGGLEIKCPGALQHVKNLTGELDERHVPQCQGSLWITGRAWWDLLSYNPVMPPALLRVTPDEEYIAALERNMAKFLSQYRALQEGMVERGFTDREPIADPLIEQLLRSVE